MAAGATAAIGITSTAMADGAGAVRSSGPIITATRSSSLYGRTITTICFSITGRTRSSPAFSGPAMTIAATAPIPATIGPATSMPNAAIAASQSTPPSTNAAAGKASEWRGRLRSAGTGRDCPADRSHRQAIQPSADQTNLLNDLENAETKAGDILRAACPRVPLDSVGPASMPLNKDLQRRRSRR